MSAKYSAFQRTVKTQLLLKALAKADKYGLALFLALAFFIPALAAPVPESARSRAVIEQRRPDLVESLKEQGLELGAPIFIQIVKSSDEGGYLKLFAENKSKEFELYRSWDVCAASGKLGPKIKTGDNQSPEGFYFVKPGAMNPWSQYHLSFNLGYPNAYDRDHGRTGSYLMVHGDCVSIGCYAMTDGGIEDIFTLMDAAFKNGQPFVRVHVFPFPMSKKNISRKSNRGHTAFWNNLKEGWDMFYKNKRPPNVEVQNKRYVFD